MFELLVNPPRPRKESISEALPAVTNEHQILELQCFQMLIISHYDSAGQLRVTWWANINMQS